MPLTKPRSQQRNGFREPHINADHAHASAQYILENRTVDIPDFEEMRSATEPSTVPAVEDAIKKLERKHKQDMDALYDHHTKAYHQEMVDYSNSYEKVQPSSGYLKYSRLRMKNQWADDLERCRYSHVSAMAPLKAKLHNMKEEQEREARLKEQRFPTTIEDYRSRSQERKQLIAKVLLSNPMQRDRLLRDNQWEMEDIKQLFLIYKTNAAFGSELISETLSESQSKKGR